MLAKPASTADRQRLPRPRASSNACSNENLSRSVSTSMKRDAQALISTERLASSLSKSDLRICEQARQWTARRPQIDGVD